jgi:quinol monooxygenase YgiN
MVTVILTHEVKNFSEWKVGYDADEANRQQAGIKMSGLYRSIDNPNVVTVIGEASDLEALNGFISSPELKAKMESLGVISAPEIKILNKA